MFQKQDRCLQARSQVSVLFCVPRYIFLSAPETYQLWRSRRLFCKSCLTAQNYISYSLAALSVAEWVFPRPLLIQHRLRAFNNLIRVSACKDICTHVYCLGPFGVFPEGDAWHVEYAAFFLHSPRICKDCARIFLEFQEFHEARWPKNPDAFRNLQAEFFHEFFGSGVNRVDDRLSVLLVKPPKSFENVREFLLDIRVLLAVECRQEIALRLQV